MQQKLNIAQIATYYYPSIGGVSGVVQYISEELVNRGHKVDVICANRDHKERPPLNAPSNEVINGVNIFRYKSWLNIGHMSFMPSLITHLIKNKYDVLHYHVYRHPVCDISAFIGSVKSSVNILHGHGPFFEEGEIRRLKHFVYNMYDKFSVYFSLRLSDKIIALNNYEKNSYVKLLGNEEKIVIIPNAADNESFEIRDSESFKEKYDLGGKKIFLCVGILNKSKRQDLLIETLPYILKEIPEAFLVLVGPTGDIDDVIEQKAKDLNVEDSYKYLGAVSVQEKHQAYNSANLFALASDKDAYPLAIAEAMAHGLPVVSTEARGPKDMVHHGIDGFIHKRRDVVGMAKSIILLLKDEELRKKMSVNARKNAEEIHSSAGVVNILEDIYFNKLKSKEKPK